jgi:hypothetical protein
VMTVTSSIIKKCYRPRKKPSQNFLPSSVN